MSPVDHSNEIRLATFNIKHGATADGFWGNPEQVAEACASLEADILALQEVERSSWRSKGADLAKLAAEAAGMEVIFAKTMRLFGGEYGNALLVRGSASNIETISLSGGKRHHLRFFGKQVDLGNEPRNAILATVHLPAGRVAVAATHLATERAIGRRQIHQLAETLNHFPMPQVLLGDFNLTRRQVMQEPLLADVELAGGEATFRADSLERKARIDHIAVRGITIQSVETRQLPISDHLALIADVGLPAVS